MMKDRMLMYEGKRQLYGTQVAGRLFVDSVTKEKVWTNFIWSIEDWENINEIRNTMDITTSIEEYANAMGVDYTKKYTLEEIENLTEK